MSVPNLGSLAGLEVTEKFDLIYYSGLVAVWVAGWVGGLRLIIGLSQFN